MRRLRPATTARLAVLGIGAVHCAALARGSRPLAVATKPLIGPALAAVAVTRTSPGRRPSPWLLGALAASTAGDVALLGSTRRSWLAGMGSFLAAHACYQRHLAGLGSLAGVRRRPLGAAAYAAGWAAANAVVGPRLGELRAPVAVYSAALAATGASSSVLGRRVATGGATFVASDLLIGLRLAGFQAPGQDVAVMASYVAAQYLLVTGAVDLAASRPSRRSSGG